MTVMYIEEANRIRMTTGDEYDVFCGRKFYCYTDRAGVCKSVKRKYNRRLRAATKITVSRAVEYQEAEA